MADYGKNSSAPQRGAMRGRKSTYVSKESLKTINMASVKRLLSYLKAYKGKLILVCICILISTGASVASSLFLQRLIDDYISPLLETANPVFSGLLRAILIMAVIYAAGIVSGLIYNRLMAVVSQGTLKIIRDEMFEHMQKLPVKYFDTNTHGDIMSHYTNDADALRQMLSQSLPSMVSSILSMVSVFCSMLYLSVWLTLMTLAFTFLCLLLVRAIGGRSSGYFIRQQKSIADVNGYVEEMVNGQKVIKVFNHEKKTEEAFNVKNEELRKNMSRANALALIIMPLMGNLGNVLYVLVAFAGGAMAIAGVPNLSVGGEAVITLGTIASFLTLSRTFMNPITQVSQQLNSIIMAMAGATRIFELLDEKPEEDEGKVSLVNVRRNEAGALEECSEKTGIWAWKSEDGTLTEVKGHIVLENVDFGYNEEKEVLHDISVYAEPGEKVALVGATGAGKTTITNLVNRFYDIQDGTITYDGIPIRDIRKYDLRKSLGIVLQDVNLFTGTVMENIRYGNLEATDEECIAAAKLANADGFITMLPEGYNTVLKGDGSGLSQGQRQLISIARAAVANPPVMILDEATSSIDTRTESIVQSGMDNLMKGRTVFVIAHRLSTVQNSDVIMVMEDGRIIERGDHDRLISEHGKYYQLYTGSFEEEE